MANFFTRLDITSRIMLSDMYVNKNEENILPSLLKKSIYSLQNHINP